MATRDELLSLKAVPTDNIKVPELGGTIRLRGLTGRELLGFQRSLELGKQNGASMQDQDGFPAKLLVRCIVDDNGDRILRDEDWPSVLEWPGTVMQRLASAAFRLCGYGADEGNL